MTIFFERVGPAVFRGVITGAQSGAHVIQVMFDGAEYPFERHCCYMQHPDKTTPYTFSNMVFGKGPPGRQVGPWPGWRGIPDMPMVTVEHMGRSTPIRFQFWGDEMTCRHVRGLARIQIQGEVECTIVSADERLVPVQAELFPVDSPGVEPIPITLRDELVGVFPRLLVTEGDLVRLRERKETTHRHLWSRIEGLFGSWDLPPAKTPESKSVEGPERLFGEDRAIIAAFRALLGPTSEHVEFARRTFLDYIALTEREDFEPLRVDTQSGETLFTLCICYDWLYRHLTADERERSKRRLWEVAEICWGHLGYERNDYAQAHFLGCGLGLLAFSFLFWESHPRACEWASYLRGTLQRVIEMVPDDGFYPHGINLWIYEYGFLLRWLELFRVCTNNDLWRGTDHWRNASRFRACATSPDRLYGVTIGDPQYRVGGDAWCHYLIASRTGSAEAQWLGEELVDGPHAGVDFRHIPPRRRVYEFLYFDPSLDPTPPAGLVQDFKDGGQVFVRTPNDGGAQSLFTFRSGPPIGHRRRRAGELGAYGHSDPANGTFLLFRGSTFLVSGPGPTYRRDTALHNTITIDGQGQIGDSTVWLPDFLPPDVIPPSTEVRTDRSSILLFADLAPTYLPHLGIQQCTRSMLVDLGHNIVGVDTIACSEPRSIEWNLHTWGTVEELNLHVLLPAKFSSRSGLTDIVPAYPHDGKRDTFLQLSVHGQRIQWIWCIGMTKDCHPEMSRDDDRITIAGLPVGPIHFDGKWLTPEGFDETRA